MGRKVRWGVLGVAGIAVKKVIPAMAKCESAEVLGLASREGSKAEAAAEELGIQRAYASYEDLIADPDIEAIYNPLPNHLHLPLTVKAAEAGKHVLCEKPIALSVAETRELIAARDRTGVLIAEAFMVRHHPQWIRTKELVSSGEIGDLRSGLGFFSYFNRNPENIRNIPEYGGGALMDIGCYPIYTSRWIFGAEPLRVMGLVERDPDMKTDRLSSAILEYPTGQMVFTCSTQLVPYQRMQFFGTKGRVEVEIPFNAPPDWEARIYVDTGADLFGGGRQEIIFEAVDQYTLQADDFSHAVLSGGNPDTKLEDSVANMAVIEALVRSGESGRWEVPERL